MTYQVLIGVKVLDDSSFALYCESVRPVLERHDGQFCYEFDVSPSCFAGRQRSINHIYALRFSNKSGMQSFFSDLEYLKARGRHVLKSIGADQVMFGYEKNDRE